MSVNRVEASAEHVILTFGDLLHFVAVDRREIITFASS